MLGRPAFCVVSFSRQVTTAEWMQDLELQNDDKSSGHRKELQPVTSSFGGFGLWFGFMPFLFSFSCLPQDQRCFGPQDRGEWVMEGAIVKLARATVLGSKESQTHSSKQAFRELQSWRVQGNPLPTLRQPFANPSPTLHQPFLPTPLQAPLSVSPNHLSRN